MVNLTVPSSIDMRLDKYLSEQLVDYSRSQIQAMIQDGKVMIDGRKENPVIDCRVGKQLL